MERWCLVEGGSGGKGRGGPDRGAADVCEGVGAATVTGPVCGLNDEGAEGVQPWEGSWCGPRPMTRDRSTRRCVAKVLVGTLKTLHMTTTKTLSQTPRTAVLCPLA